MLFLRNKIEKSSNNFCLLKTCIWWADLSYRWTFQDWFPPCSPPPSHSLAPWSDCKFRSQEKKVKLTMVVRSSVFQRPGTAKLSSRSAPHNSLKHRGSLEIDTQWSRCTKSNTEDKRLATFWSCNFGHLPWCIKIRKPRGRRCWQRKLAVGVQNVSKTSQDLKCDYGLVITKVASSHLIDCDMNWRGISV